MNYLLREDVALRSWSGSPYAYLRLDEDLARRLTKEEFETLLLCDGTHEMKETMMISMLQKKGLIRPAGAGERLSAWQKVRYYSSRYMPQANWMITGRCNYNCLHCFNAADNNHLQSEFTMEEAERLLDEFASCGVHALLLTGGEPMLHPHFLDIVRRIYQQKMHVFELNTNGSFITQEVLGELLDLGCRPLMKISFDGVGHHDWLRNRPGAEEAALHAIRLCKANGFPVMVQTNVHKKNVQVMLETARLMDSLGVDSMRIIRTTEAPRWLLNAGNSCLGIEDYFNSMTELCRDYVRTGCRMSLNIWQFVTVHPDRRIYSLDAVRCEEGAFRGSRPVCRGNRNMIAIGANGHVYPCLQMSGYYEETGDILGNVKTDSLKSILTESPYLREVCTTVDEHRAQCQTCRDCRWFKYCAGGCPAIALALTGHKRAPDLFRCLFFGNDYIGKLAQAMPDYICTTALTTSCPGPR